ncbi:MAG: WD40/YVTN/BNR-like repeat-containing protein [Bryobacteraceae bacterium]
MTYFMRTHFIALLLSSLCAPIPIAAQTKAQQVHEKRVEEAQPLDKEKEKKEQHGMQYRLIGPFRGGRSLTASGVPSDPNTWYFGSTGGGIWKSTDAAITWKPIFDHERSSSIGSLAVAPSDPNVIYAGTGEACIRGNLAQGDGVYKSIDAGKTWKNVGLKDSRAIGKLIIHPSNPEIVYVAAFGHPYGPNPERGVFRTLDGGKTWQKVLFVNDNTGAADVTFDPHNPRILFASLWQVRRQPWTLSSGGAGSGLYRSIDGGDTWKQMKGEGFPEGPYGKIGVAVAANSDRVWALIEAKQGGLYRSDDSGDTWQLINSDDRFTQRAWYYMHIIADPKDSNTVYILNVDFHRSTDGGHTFNKIKVPHGDNHGLWIDPLNTSRMIQSDDGGATVTFDGGEHWTPESNQPTAQFYHVIADNRFPYYLYGAQQDNTTVAIASRDPEGEIDRQDWYPVGGGEAGYIAPDPRDPLVVYAGDYQGNITRFDKHTAQLRNVTVHPVLSDAKGAAVLEHRFQWTAPLLISPHDPNTVYHAAERIFKTTDGGTHWEAISPDLTRNDKSKQQPSGGPITTDDTGTEYYDTVFAVAESPLEKGLIWAGTDDGLIQLTRDGGQTWNNVTPKDLPEWSKISQIDASPHDAGTVWVAVDRHANDDLKPYIYSTTNYGKTWNKLVNGIPESSFVRTVREDPKRKGLLFAGTETGVFWSKDAGQNWASLQLNLPTVPIHDLVIKDNDLLLATHGRSFWILDDISPLRQANDQSANADVWLYEPAAALRVHSPAPPDKPSLTAGENPPGGAVIYAFTKTKPKHAKLEILDTAGKVIRTYSSDVDKETEEQLDPEDEKPKKQLELKPGMNRLVWDLRYEGPPRIENYWLYEYENGSKGPMALPGKYQVRLIADGRTLATPLELKLDPRLNVPREDLEKQFALLMDIRSQLTRVYDLANEVIDLRKQLADMKKRLDPDRAKPLILEAQALDERLGALQNQLVNTKVRANEDSLKFGLGVDGNLADLAIIAGGNSDAAPTEASVHEFAKVKAEVDGYAQRWKSMVKTEIPKFQQTAEQQKLGPLIVRDPSAAVSGSAK